MKRSGGETSWGQNVLGVKRPGGEYTRGEISGDEMSEG